MKKLLLAVSLLGAFFLIGTASNAQAQNKITVGAIWGNLANEFAAKIKDAAQAEANKLGVTLLSTDGQGDATKQIAAAENFVTQKVNVMMIQPFDFEGSAPAVDLAVKAGIPVVLVNSAVSNGNECRVYVGSDDVYAGELEAGYMAKRLDGKGNIVVMDGFMAQSPQIYRSQGYQHILDKNPGIKVLSTQSAEWDRAKGLALAENWLTSGLPINGILAQNDEMAMGAVAALEERGKTGSILVMGIDAIGDALRAVADGRLAATVFQDAVGQGGGSIDAAYKIANGQKLPDKIVIPFVLVTKDNVKKYLH